MKTKFNSDNELTLNKTTEIPSMIKVVRALFNENNKYYPHVFSEQIMNNIKILYYDRIDVSEGIDINKTKGIKRNVIFVTNGVF